MSYFSHIIYRKNLPATCFCLQLAHGGGPGRAGTVLTGLPGTGVSGESAVVSGDAVSLLIPPERLKNKVQNIYYRISIQIPKRNYIDIIISLPGSGDLQMYDRMYP